MATASIASDAENERSYTRMHRESVTNDQTPNTNRQKQRTYVHTYVHSSGVKWNGDLETK